MQWYRITVASIFGMMLTFVLEGQTTLNGQVEDAASGKGIPYVNLLNLTDKSGATTDEQGVFELSIRSFPCTLRISAIGYRTDTIVADADVRLLIRLQPIRTDLPMVEVRARSPLRQLRPDGQLPFDFAIWRDQLFVLSQRHSWSKPFIEAWSSDGIMLYRHQLDMKSVRGIEVNCRNRLYLQSSYHYINLGYTEAQVVLLEKMALQDYQMAYKYCRCSNTDAMYYENISSRGLQKRYLRADLRTGALLEFREVVYTEQLADYRASLGLIQQGQLANNTGDVSREENDQIRNAQQRSDFLQQVMFKNPKDNYLFSQGDRVYLFNTDESSIETYDADGNLIHQAAANYLDHEDWEDKVIQDRKTGLFYGLLRSSKGYALAAIDPESGELGAAVPLHIGFYEKIVVYNFQAYVLGTPLYEGTKGIDRLYVKGLR